MLTLLNVRVALMPMDVVSPGLLSAGVQLLVSGAFATLLVQLLLVRQNRRKIDGEASQGEANAASQLSGAALTMVKSANEDTEKARKGEQAAREQANTLWAELTAARVTIQTLTIENQVLKAGYRTATGQEPPSLPPTQALPPPPVDPPPFAD